jgi:hypothetical protein
MTATDIFKHSIAVVDKVRVSADQYRQSWIGGPPVAPPAGLISDHLT